MEETTFALPSAYSENALVLMVCSPTVIFAYWDFSRHLKETLAASGGFCLRLMEVDKHAVEKMMPLYEPDAFVGEKSIYFTVLPGSKYRCELGFYTEEGVFIPVLISNTAVTPGGETGTIPDCDALAEIAATVEGGKAGVLINNAGYSGTLMKKYGCC